MSNSTQTTQTPRTPQINTVLLEWTQNYLIPLTLRGFYRQGVRIIIYLLLFTLLCFAGYFVSDEIFTSYEDEITRLQSATTTRLNRYSAIKDRSNELSLLASWRKTPSISEQFAALSFLIAKNSCFLAQSVFHSGTQDIPEKLLNDITPEFERVSKNRMSVLSKRIIGIWNVSLRLPISGLGTTSTRNSIIASLQKDSIELFKGANANTGISSALVLHEEHGQSMLKNSDNMNALLVIWN